MRRFGMPLGWLAHSGPEELSAVGAVSHLGVRGVHVRV